MSKRPRNTFGSSGIPTGMTVTVTDDALASAASASAAAASATATLAAKTDAQNTMATFSGQVSTAQSSIAASTAAAAASAAAAHTSETNAATSATAAASSAAAAAATAIGSGTLRVDISQSLDSASKIRAIANLGLHGIEAPFAGVTPPPGWLLEFGQALSRTTYSALYEALTIVVTGNLVSSSAAVSSVSTDLTLLGLVGAKIEGTGIAAGTTVAAVSTSTITLSQPATGTGSAVNLRLLPHGNGDGASTFNIPDARGIVTIGRDNMGGVAANRVTNGVSGIDGTRLGVRGGDQALQAHTHTLSDPGHAHPTVDPGHTHLSNELKGATGGNTGLVESNTSGSGANWAVSPALTGVSVGVTQTGISVQSSGTGASQNVQPSRVSNMIIFAGV